MPITCPYDWLLIRATKCSVRPLKRLRRIWCARCALDPSTISDRADKYIAERLIGILERCGGIRWMTVLDYADPAEIWKLGGNLTKEPHWTRIMLALASQIGGKQVDEFIDYRSPARFRNAA